MVASRIEAVFRTFALALATLFLGAVSPSAAPLTIDVRPENRTVLIPGPGDGTIRIQVTAPDLPPIGADRPRLNLALVLDRSGSMSEAGKLDYVKTAAHQLVDMMGPDDILSVVAYDHLVQVPWPSRPVGRDRAEIHRIIAGLYPGGATFLSGGLEEGYRQVRGSQGRGFLNRVLLLSDGLANRGTTGRGELRERAAVLSEMGISVSTFGVGHDFDEDLLAMVAAGGGGKYRYLGDPERIVAALSDEFRTASRTSAAEVEIVIRLRRDCRFGSVIGREWKRDGDAYVIRLGDLSAGERRTVFANLNVAGERPGPREVGDVTLRYRDPATSKAVTASAKAVSLELVRDARTYREGFDRAVQEGRAVAESGALVQEAARLADRGKKEEAKKLLDKASAGLAAAPPSPAVSAEIEHANRYKVRLDEMNDMASEPARATQKEIKYRAYETLQQR